MFCTVYTMPSSGLTRLTAEHADLSMTVEELEGVKTAKLLCYYLHFKPAMGPTPGRC